MSFLNFHLEIKIDSPKQLMILHGYRRVHCNAIIIVGSESFSQLNYRSENLRNVRPCVALFQCLIFQVLFIELSAQGFL